MKRKMSIEDFKNYVISEAKKLYKIAILKEEKEEIEKSLSDDKVDYINQEIDSKIIQKIRNEMLKKASGWK